MSRFSSLRRGVMTLFAAVGLALIPALMAQDSAGPQPAPLPAPIATPVDAPYPGSLSLLVDLTNVTDRVIQVRERIPVSGAEVTLLYPEWIPGYHSPVGPIAKIAGLVVTAQGKRIAWVRDRLNVYAFHVEIPPGAKTLEVNFQFLAPLRKQEGRISFSSEIADLSWNTVLLYPAGYFSRDIEFAPSVRLPEGWKFASALKVESQQGNLVRFQKTHLNTLADSPLYAGAYYKREDLSTGPDNRVFLNVFADKAAELAITPEELQFHRNMVKEAAKLFQSRHYKQYDFLLSVSDTITFQGLEHHQSSEDSAGGNYFTDWNADIADRDLLAHEYSHSWNGKFRRPWDLWTPNFNVPMQNDLLWVYEGLTQYYGYVLTARSGMRTPEQTRDLMAAIAANLQASPGRDWRPLVDTTNQPIVSERSPVSWVSWQRAEEYYMEGLLVWLDVDTKIRELSGGAKSLDDFAKSFYGVDNGSLITKTYTFDDIVAALKAVQPYDWTTFLRSRIYHLRPQVPEEGFTQGGYRLTYNDTQPEWMKQSKSSSGASFATSLGFSTSAKGDLVNVWWGSLAYKAGITPDMHVEAVDDNAFSIENLRAAIVSAEKTNTPIKLLLKRGDRFSIISLDYHGGPRYPHLERIKGTQDRLDEILAPSK